ncbi:hypothetical protein HW555_006647 [Spodoptera exigua]|uniref:Uncharacterized protein n=1 Tax=Spodoptera exigua TaxID=7107 RepID=A0A835GHJ3_SPOEX|nr:hypothetical protein HW555_006647 [Spodoptera exigua]
MIKLLHKHQPKHFETDSVSENTIRQKLFAWIPQSKSSRNIYTPPGSTDSYDRNGELIRVARNAKVYYNGQRPVTN